MVPAFSIKFGNPYTYRSKCNRFCIFWYSASPFRPLNLPQNVQLFGPNPTIWRILLLCINPSLQQHMHRRTTDKLNICTWEGIGCIDGHVNTLHLTGDWEIAGISWIIVPDWLPPKLQYVHLENIRFRGLWKPQRLPRELRYLYLSGCYDIKIGINPRDSTPISFGNLPAKMEELILIGSHVGRCIHINHLPNAMRLVYIRAYPEYTLSIAIDYNALPAALEHLHVTPMHEPNDFKRVIEIRGKPKGVKLVTKPDNAMPYKVSLYTNTFTNLKF